MFQPFATRRRSNIMRVNSKSPTEVRIDEATRPSRTIGVRSPDREARAQCVCGGGCPRCAPPRVQASLWINEPGDVFERQADLIAEHVIRGSDTIPAITATKGAGGFAAPVAVKEPLSRQGQALDHETRSLMESRMGHDFSGVRIHADAQAADAAGSIGARAYTVGGHIVFADGQYRPGTSSGKRLIAHELTHVVQQTSGGLGLVQCDFEEDALRVLHSVRASGGEGLSEAERRTRSAAIAERRLRLRTLFASLSIEEARRIHGRLRARVRGDALSERFYDTLATATRNELLGILAATFGARPQEAPRLGTEQYVDAFEHVVYDMFNPPGPSLSEILHIVYADGTEIAVNINDIGDASTVPIADALADDFLYVGPGGRLFPRTMNRGTVPNLWFAKRQALILMDQYNFDLMSMMIVPVMMVTTPSMVGGTPTVRSIPRARFGGYSRGGPPPLWGRWADYPHVAFDGEEYAIINGRLYTRHVVDRMGPSGYFWGRRVGREAGQASPHTGGQPQVRMAGGDYGRGVSPQHIEEVISTGSSRPASVAAGGGRVRPGSVRTSYESDSVQVITESYRGDPAGIVITVITH